MPAVQKLADGYRRWPRLDRPQELRGHLGNQPVTGQGLVWLKLVRRAGVLPAADAGCGRAGVRPTLTRDDQPAWREAATGRNVRTRSIIAPPSATTSGSRPFHRPTWLSICEQRMAPGC